jgi:hypothetical protein
LSRTRHRCSSSPRCLHARLSKFSTTRRRAPSSVSICAPSSAASSTVMRLPVCIVLCPAFYHHDGVLACMLAHQITAIVTSFRSAMDSERLSYRQVIFGEPLGLLLSTSASCSGPPAARRRVLQPVRVFDLVDGEDAAIIQMAMRMLLPYAAGAARRPDTVHGGGEMSGQYGPSIELCRLGQRRRRPAGSISSDGLEAHRSSSAARSGGRGRAGPRRPAARAERATSAATPRGGG